MGQDYKLKKAYEKVLTSEQTEPKVLSLSRIYERQVLGERAAFYAKDIGDSTDSPDIEGLENLGVVEQPNRIKKAITSLSLMPAVEQLSTLADETGKGWHMPPIEHASLDVLSDIFSSAGMSGSDVHAIAKAKTRLTSCESAIKCNVANSFNLKNVIVGDLKRIKSLNSEKLSALFDELFRKTAKVGLAAVGAGEIAVTMLSNAQKGKTGDLVFNGDVVEVKAKKGRLGKADFSNSGTVLELAKYLKLYKIKQTRTKLSFEKKETLRKLKQALESNVDVMEVLDKKYLNALQACIASVFEPRQLRTEANKASLLLTGNQIKDQYLKQYQVPVSKAVKDLFIRIHNNVRAHLQDLLKQKYDPKLNLLSPSVIANQTFNIAVPKFFLSDIGLTWEQAAEVFMWTKSQNINHSAYVPAVRQYFKTHYKDMMDGDRRKLEAILFGYLLAIYAKGDGSDQKFDYFFMVNDESYAALTINVSKPAGQLVLNAAELYLKTPGLDLDIRADSTHGACAVTFNG